MSASTTYIVYIYDIANRYPVKLVEARCRCQHGVSLGSKTACEQVHYNVRVLRQTGECTAEGYVEYLPGWQSISVGCTMTLAEASQPSSAHCD